MIAAPSDWMIVWSFQSKAAAPGRKAYRPGITKPSHSYRTQIEKK
jgi:hypothetical protein